MWHLPGNREPRTRGGGGGGHGGASVVQPKTVYLLCIYASWARLPPKDLIGHCSRTFPVTSSGHACVLQYGYRQLVGTATLDF